MAHTYELQFAQILRVGSFMLIIIFLIGVLFYISLFFCFVFIGFLFCCSLVGCSLGNASSTVFNEHVCFLKTRVILTYGADCSQ